jgi:putative ATPase
MPLRLAFESGQPHSCILWGPPGVGKTTIARLMADAFDAQFISISAVLGGVKDIRERWSAPRRRATGMQQRTIVFVDEVHRFNKSQQDAFLPHVESGLFTFIGATTENPSFEVNSALLSRAAVYVLQPLVRRRFEANCGPGAMPASGTSYRKRSNRAPGGLCRWRCARGCSTRWRRWPWRPQEQLAEITDAWLLKVLGERCAATTRAASSSTTPSARCTRACAAPTPTRRCTGWCACSTAAPTRATWRAAGAHGQRGHRPGRPARPALALDAAEVYERLGSPEGELALAECVVYLAVAPKSNAVYKAYNEAAPS